MGTCKNFSINDGNISIINVILIQYSFIERVIFMQKTILITGCSSGIGLCAANILKQRGYRVFATARKQDDVEKLKQQGFESFLLDVADSVSIQKTVEQILSLTSGTLDALCNNAGFAQPGALEDLNRNSLRAQFETNVFGLQELTNAILPVMRKQGHGRIIYMSSILGFISLPFRGAYNSSKYAVEGLADTLRLELRNSQIFVSLIEPGPIHTEFRNNALKAYQQNIKKESSFHQKNYKKFLQHFFKNKDQLLLGAGPQAVVKKIIYALEDKKPKARYYVTLPTHLFAILKRILPQRTLDSLLSIIAKKEVSE